MGQQASSSLIRKAFAVLFSMVLVFGLMPVGIFAQQAFADDTSGATEETTSYTVNIADVANGTIQASVSQAEEGEVVTLTVTPDEGSKLKPDSLKVTTEVQGAPRYVSGEGTAESPYTFVMPDDNVTVTAEFDQVYSITAADGMEHGTLSTNVTEAVEGETVTITVQPDEGYRLKFESTTNNPNKTLRGTYGDNATTLNIPDYIWDAENSAYIDCNIEAVTYNFTMPAGDVELSAEFTKAYSVTVADSVQNGTVQLSGRTEAGEGERVAAWGIADAGYEVVSGSFAVETESGSPVEYNSNYSEFFMPAENVVISVDFNELPKLSSDVNFTVESSDSAVICTWNVPAQYANMFVYYREAGSDDAYQYKNLYDGRLQVGDSASLTIDGLTNGVEYEFYLSVNNAVSDTLNATPEAIAPTGVYINRESATVVLGETMALYGSVLPSESKSTDLTWTSSDESVATVSEHGVVEGVGLGSATITATAVNGVSASCEVEIVESSDTPAGGSMVIGTVDAEYNEDGGTVYVPFTLTVPTDRPIFKATFEFGSLGSNGTITGISLNGQSLSANSTTQVDDINITLGSIPAPAWGWTPWATITPAEGTFLEPGKTYEFTLEIQIKSTAQPVFSINFSNSTNNRAFYYYDYDNSPTGSRFAMPEVQTSGQVNATWTGEGIPHMGQNYYISSADDLMWYVEQVNAGQSYNAILYSDIDLTDTDFDGIGTEEHPFASTFNGNGHTVTIDLDDSDGGAVGFIRYMNGGTVYNLTVDGSINVDGGTANVGGIVGELTGNGYLQYCVNKADITVSGSAGGNVGGVVGYSDSVPRYSWNGVVGNCTNYGTINASGTGVTTTGGIAGYVKNGSLSANANGGENRTSTVSDEGSVTGRGYVGGIVGLFENDDTGKNISDCTNLASVNALSGEAVGGIAGKVVSAHIGGTYNGANRTEYPTRNYGSVTGNVQYAGGIAGYVDDTATGDNPEYITLNYNEGRVESTSGADAYVGGIMAYLTGSADTVVSGNVNKGELVAPAGATVGGVLAASENALTEANCADNYYADVEGLSDAAYGIAAPADWLSINGYAPQYSGTGGDGSAENPYLIANVNDFLWFTSQVNTGTEANSSPGKDYCVKLVADIDLSDYPDYEGIGTTTYPGQTYYGTFDGDGHTITLALDGTTTGGQALGGNMALFRSVSGTIKNLNIEGSVKGTNVAGVALSFGGTMENVNNYADITNVHDTTNCANSTPGNAAGIVSSLYQSTLINVNNYGDVTGHNASGIACTFVTGGTIDQCANYGNVTACLLAAGIVGSVDAGALSTDDEPSFTISNTVNNGTITSNSATVLDNTAWYGNIDPSSNHSAGGIVGKVGDAIVQIVNCTNNGLVQNTGNNAGGILGSSSFGRYQDTDFRIINSTNNGDVVSNYDGDDPWYLSHISVGGIVGNTGGEFDPSSNQNPWGTPGWTQEGVITGSTNNGNIIAADGTNKGAIGGLVTGESPAVSIDNNYSSVEVDSGGWGPSDGTYFDSAEYEVVDGALVPRNSGTTDETTDGTTSPTNPTSPSGATGATGSSSADAAGASEAAVLMYDDSAAGGQSTAQDAAAQSTESAVAESADEAQPAQSSASSADSDEGDEAEGQASTLFEVVSQTVAQNPVLFAAIIAAFIALVCAGIYWGYRSYRDNAK